MISKHYYSNGKILLTGEYAVLFGARALAFPLVYGQELNVKPASGNGIYWKAWSGDKLWFEAEYKLPDLQIRETNDMEKALFLKKILEQLILMNCKFMESGHSIHTNANFPVNWGFGTSSTLIHNLALWADINPFELFYKVSKGSGYDIACAGSNSPLVFQRLNNTPEYQPVRFRKSFLHQIFLIFSGQKKPTEQHVESFLKQAEKTGQVIKEISEITDKIVLSESLEEFIQLLKLHEEIISQFLCQETIHRKSFADFKGVVKSLGAWGGDFFLAAASDAAYVNHYFEQFGYSVILPFEKCVLL